MAVPLLSMWMVALPPSARGYSPQAQQPALEAQTGTLHGTVWSALHRPVSGAVVKLRMEKAAAAAETVTDAFGTYSFYALQLGAYTVSVEYADARSQSSAILSPQHVSQPVDLILGAPGDTTPTRSENQTPEFSDKPTFSVAGVTDWTAVGGHGSDAILRTSEDMTRDTMALKTSAQVPAASHAGEIEGKLLDVFKKAPASYAANHNLGEYYLHAARYSQAIPLLKSASLIQPTQADDEYDLALACWGVGDLKQAQQHVQSALAKKDTADEHRLAGELDESLGDPLAAVQEEDRAVRLDPSEENYFIWGSELLLHRAVWQASQVFAAGVRAHPESARLLTGWGTALFASALYGQAAERLCAASDLEPADPQPYLFMSKADAAAPAPLPCVEQRLARFAEARPTDATAKYEYAMCVYKRAEASNSAGADMERVESLLLQAVTLDAQCAGAYLQLGIMASAHHDYAHAIAYYARAIQADPQLAEAHYRLGLAYDRTGNAEDARKQFEMHDAIEKAQADAVEQQRREVKQFVVVLEAMPTDSKSH